MVVWLAGAVLLTAVTVGLVGGPAALDDPDQAKQRSGLLVDASEALDVRGLGLPGRPGGREPVFIAFARTPPGAADLAKGVAHVAEGFSTVVVVPGGARPGTRVAGVPVVIDSAGRIARAVGMERPEDGGPPVGYAVIDVQGLVRYATIDPTWPRHGFEVELITKAVR